MVSRLAVTGVIGELLKGVLGDLDSRWWTASSFSGPSRFLEHMDLHMLVMLGGRERIELEWRDLPAARAFEITETTSAGRANLIDARPI
jgi:hypothetical protein